MLIITLSHRMCRQTDLEPIAGGAGVGSGVISSAKQRRASAFMAGVTVVILKDSSRHLAHLFCSPPPCFTIEEPAV